MRHLILGSEGQIGRHLIHFLTSANEDVIEFDILRNASEDLRLYNNDALLGRIKDCDIVHFLAFDIGGSKYMNLYQDSYAFLSNNVKIMNTVFDVLKNSNKPFIFASSQMSNMLHSTYGILKSLGERYTRSLDGIIVKLWNVYGYENNPDKSHVITDFIAMAKKERSIRMRTDGEEARQFLYADDCSEYLFLISKMYNDIDRNKSLHISSFEWTKIIDIAKLVSAEFSDCEIVPSKRKDTIQKNIRNEPDDYILNFLKPKTTLQQGIRKIIDLMQ